MSWSPCLDSWIHAASSMWSWSILSPSNDNIILPLSPLNVNNSVTHNDVSLVLIPSRVGMMLSFSPLVPTQTGFPFNDWDTFVQLLLCFDPYTSSNLIWGRLCLVITRFSIEWKVLYPAAVFEDYNGRLTWFNWLNQTSTDQMSNDDKRRPHRD